MKRFDVQSIELHLPAAAVFDYVATPGRLPEWTNAFSEVNEGRARLRTPQGEVEITLAVHARAEAGTIDWEMTFPDGSKGMAYSRVLALDAKSCVYSFVLTPPPVPLEQLEGALDAQSKILAEELHRLQGILERRR
jgi:hypothetical protein